MGAGSFTLNISMFNGSVAINTGIVQGIITQTVSDQNPIAIFGVSKILLPREIFGKNPIMFVKSPPDIGAPPPYNDASSPSGFEGQPSHLSSPPRFGEDVTSNVAGVYGSELFSFVLCCINLYLLPVLPPFPAARGPYPRIPSAPCLLEVSSLIQPPSSSTRF
ncbi:hypothetical protein RYX36_000584, partial [Vicia faba]